MTHAVPLSYRLPFVPAVYDALNALLWLPGGSGSLRAAFVDALDVRSGDHVVEIGCGSGQVTQRLCATGARVTALDWSRPMLRRTARRAPQARLIQGDALSFTEAATHVALGFILHELAPPRRVALLAHAAGLAPRVGILEWAVPRSGWRRAMWRTTIRCIEGGAGLDVTDGQLERDLAYAELDVVARRSLAGGRAQVLIAARRS